MKAKNYRHRFKLITRLPKIVYRSVGRKTRRLLPLFKDIDFTLRKSRVRINFRVYASYAVFVTILLSISALVVTPTILIVVYNFGHFLSFLFGIGTSLLTGALTTALFYAYPTIRADNLKRRLEDDLPFSTGYMMILSDSGVPPNHVFSSLAKVDAQSSIINEARIVTQELEVFGKDVITALKYASDHSPSPVFKTFLEGFISTIHSGADLMTYLMSRSRQYIKLKQIALRRFLDTLSVLSEFYVALLIAGPLILMVMLTVMAMLGGGGEGLSNPRLLLYLLTYLVIPAGSVTLLILLDVISPRR